MVEQTEITRLYGTCMETFHPEPCTRGAVLIAPQTINASSLIGSRPIVMESAVSRAVSNANGFVVVIRPVTFVSRK